MRVVIGEDLGLLRDGLVALFRRRDVEVAAAVDNGPDLLDALLTHRPDLGVIDVRLPPSHTDEGLRAALAARAEIPGLPVLILSQYVEPLYARELVADSAVAVGYLLKNRVTDFDQFFDTVQRVVAGGTAFDPTVVARLMASHARDQRLAELTARERQVLSHMAAGHSNASIGRYLLITEKAVAKHTNSIFSKLGLQDSADTNRRVRAVLAYLQG